MFPVTIIQSIRNAFKIPEGFLIGEVKIIHSSNAGYSRLKRQSDIKHLTANQEAARLKKQGELVDVPPHLLHYI